jgi:hypothetical protein
MTLDEGIPEDVKRAIGALVESLDHLQILLLLYRGRDRGFKVTEIVMAVGIQEGSARRELERMRGQALALLDEATGAYRYHAEDGVDADVARIAAAYGTNRIAVINHVASRTLQRIRALADAFRLGKGSKDG